VVIRFAPKPFRATAKTGWQTSHVTSPKQGVATAPIEEVDGFTFYRSEKPKGVLATMRFLHQWTIVQSLANRLDEIIPEIKPDILHAHSPALKMVWLH